MKKYYIYFLLAAIILAIFLSPFASSFPDGLEKVMERFEDAKQNIAINFNTIMPDYLFPGVKNQKVATSVAGGIGVLLTFGFIYLTGKLIARKKDEKKVKEL